MNISKYILSTAAAILLFSSCSDDGADLFINNLPATLTMKVGESISLAGNYNGNRDELVVFPAGADDFSYQTSTNGIVDVTKRGMVIPRETGSTTILVKDKETNQTLRNVAVEVLPTLTLSVKLGDVVSLKDLVPEDDLKGIGYYAFKNTDKNIADINSKFEIQTKSTGKTSIYYQGYFDEYNQEYKIKAIWIDITVEPAFSAPLFTLPYLKYYATIDEVRSQMSGYNLIEEKDDVKLEYFKYHTLTYGPYKEAKSVTYYFDKVYDYPDYAYKLVYVSMNTGKPGEEVEKYLMQIGQYWYHGYKLNNAPQDYWSASYLNNSWTELLFKYTSYFTPSNQ